MVGSFSNLWGDAGVEVEDDRGHWGYKENRSLPTVSVFDCKRRWVMANEVSAVIMTFYSRFPNMCPL